MLLSIAHLIIIHKTRCLVQCHLHLDCVVVLIKVVKLVHTANNIMRIETTDGLILQRLID